MRNSFKEIPSDNPEEFLGHLDSLLADDKTLNTSVDHQGYSIDANWYSNWIFRGQCQDWHLTPSIWRTNAGSLSLADSLFRRMKQDDLADTIDQYSKAYEEIRKKNRFRNFEIEIEKRTRIIDAFFYDHVELFLVNQFAYLANYVGHRVPQVDRVPSKIQALKRFFDNVMRYYAKTEGHWQRNLDQSGIDTDGYFSSSVVMLAQHHGIPTRLLDWTRTPYIAAFFACDDAIEKNVPQNEDIVVWAIHTNALTNTALRIVTALRSDSEYLHAQDGVFLYYQGATRYYIEHGKWPDIEKALSQLTCIDTEAPLVRKLKLKSRFAGDLMRLLWKRGISRAHLMPTYDNVAASLKIKWKLQNLYETEDNVSSDPVEDDL